MKKTYFSDSSGAVATAPINKNVIKVGAGKSMGLSFRIIYIVAIAILALTSWSVPGQTATIAAGNFHSLGIKSDGHVVAWGGGGNNYGQSNVPPGLSQVVAIAAGDYHSLALKSDGSVVAWGDNDYGQCVVPPGLNLKVIFKTPRKPISPILNLLLLGEQQVMI